MQQKQQGRETFTGRNSWFLLLTKSNRVIKTRSMRWLGYVACMVEKQNWRRILEGNPEGNRPRVVPKCRWKNFKRDFKQTELDNCVNLGYNAASPEDGNEMLSRNVGKKLPLLAALTAQKIAVLIFFRGGILKSHKLDGRWWSSFIGYG